MSSTPLLRMAGSAPGGPDGSRAPDGSGPARPPVQAAAEGEPVSAPRELSLMGVGAACR